MIHAPRTDRKEIAVAAIGTVSEIYEEWQIGYILIDNTTGSWIQVGNINRTIPPHTIGWAAAFKPTTQRFQLTFVNAPTGGLPSQQVGGPVIVNLYENQQPELSGNSYDLPQILTQLDTDIVALGIKLDTIHADLGTVHTDLLTLHTDLGTLHTDLQTLNTTLTTTNTKLDTLNTSINTLDADIRALTGGFGAATTLLTFTSSATNTDGIPHTIIAAQAGKSIHLVSVSISIVNLSVLPWDTYTWGLFDTSVILVSGAFSATTKLYDAFDFGGQGLKGTVNTDLQFVANNLLGDTGMALQYTLQYYFA